MEDQERATAKSVTDAEQEKFNRYWDMFRFDHPVHTDKGIEFLLSFLCTVVVMTADDPATALKECSDVIAQQIGLLNLVLKQGRRVQ